jgi:hypothetical protein
VLGLIKELDMLKMFKSPLTCGAREINIIRTKLKERYTKIWREKINLVKQNPATNNEYRILCKNESNIFSQNPDWANTNFKL